MIELSNVRTNEKVADLGSGDGRIAVAFAKLGAKVDAYELAEKQVEELRANLTKENLTAKVKVIQEDFWQVDFSQYDIIAIYPMPDIMDMFEKKLEKELSYGARVLLNYYPLPNWKHKAVKDNVYLYVR